MTSACEKLELLLEAPYSPLWRGEPLSLNERLERIYGPTIHDKLESVRARYFRWLSVGPKRVNASLILLCEMIMSKFGIEVDPNLIVSRNVSIEQFARSLGISEIRLDLALQDMKLNQVLPVPDLLNLTVDHVRMKPGIWLVERWTDEERTRRRSTCILVIHTEMLEYRHGDGPKASHFAYLFTPFGGVHQNPGSRKGVTKYVGRGAYVNRSLEFHFTSVDRTPLDKADMRIMPRTKSHSRFDGGYVSMNIDRGNRPGVRWINVTYLTSEVSVESIDLHCAQHVRSADALIEEAQQSPPPPAPRGAASIDNLINQSQNPDGERRARNRTAQKARRPIKKKAAEKTGKKGRKSARPT